MLPIAVAVDICHPANGILCLVLLDIRSARSVEKFLLKSFFLTLLMVAMFVPRVVLAASSAPLMYEDEEISMRIVLRTPMQLSAFYQGREFNQAAIDEILKTCFITPIIKNKTLDVLWLELNLWEFSVGKQAIRRIKRDYWSDRWRETKLPQAQQSTFGWTLMPEIRDLRLDESVGGSVVIPIQRRPFTLTARFHTTANRQGKLKSVVFEDITCATNNE